MADAPEHDDQDESEALDADKVGDGDYPPERPLGVGQYGLTPQEERIDEPLEERRRREVPDGQAGAVQGVPLAADVAGGDGRDDPERDGDGVDLLDGLDPEGQLDGDLAEEEENPYAGELDRTPRSAEEDAVHIVEDPS